MPSMTPFAGPRRARPRKHPPPLPWMAYDAIGQAWRGDDTKEGMNHACAADRRDGEPG